MMFRWGQTLYKTSGCSGAITRDLDSIFIRSQCTTTCEMGDKFKLPSRYGTGEKSVWLVTYIN